MRVCACDYPLEARGHTSVGEQLGIMSQNVLAVNSPSVSGRTL